LVLRRARWARPDTVTKIFELLQRVVTLHCLLRESVHRSEIFRRPIWRGRGRGLLCERKNGEEKSDKAKHQSGDSAH
jgi:hypothetical protein